MHLRPIYRILFVTVYLILGLPNCRFPGFNTKRACKRWITCIPGVLGSKPDWARVPPQKRSFIVCTSSLSREFEALYNIQTVTSNSCHSWFHPTSWYDRNFLKTAFPTALKGTTARGMFTTFRSRIFCLPICYCKESNIQNLNFACFVWVWNLVPHIEGRT